MLESLYIKNYVLIRNLKVNFRSGFNILTGETGAGKSILAGALNLLFGAKGDVSSISEGASETQVTGVLSVDNNLEAKKWLTSNNIIFDDDQVIINRILKKTGRGPMEICSTPVTRNQLQEFSELVISVHSQHEHVSLLRTNNQRILIDKYAGCQDLAEKMSKIFAKLSSQKQRLAELEAADKNRERELDYLKFSVNEIEKANLKKGEIEELEAELKVISQAEKLFENLELFISSVSEYGDGALKSLREGNFALKNLSAIDSSLSNNLERFETAFFEIEDINETIKDYKNRIDFDPSRVDDLQSRLHFIRRLESKYGNGVENILLYLEESRAKIDSLENYEEQLSNLRKEISKTERETTDIAIKLSEKRKIAAKKLEKSIEENIRPLGMEKAIFTIDLKQKLSENGRPLCSSNGFDYPEFLIASNVGEPAKPIKSVASGGELSRILLAIKTVFTELDFVGTLVFDEVDAGIGGEVGVAVAKRLEKLSKSQQILCITHLASIASLADNHLLVEKNIVDGVTVTSIRSIEEEDRVVEIARMLSGDTVSSAALEHARQMVERDNI